MELIIKKYESEQLNLWDRFVLQESMNGTFLQTRRFIEYHPEGRFRDYSLLCFKGSTVVAAILACEIKEENTKVFFSHKGTTFGGIVISEKFYSASNVDILMKTLEQYLIDRGFDKILLKMTSTIFCKKNTELLDYFLFQRNYEQYDELNYYMNLERYKDDIISQFSSSKRRDYRYSLKNNLKYHELVSQEEIKEFYNVLQLNLKKLGLPCVHKFEELLDLKYNRFMQNIEFYGVYREGRMIAGSMVFLFNGEILHTQYLASDENYLEYFPMDFLIYNLIHTAIEKGLKTFTFGICTENKGKYLNLGLSRFKEGFGTEFCINRTFYKKL